MNLKVNLSSDWPKDFCKRITRLPCWSFHNKFLIRDTITICSNATNNCNFIKFWSSKHNHERICHGFIHSRGLTLIVGKFFDTTKGWSWSWLDILSGWMLILHGGNPKTQVDRCLEFECITKYSKEIGDLSGT